MSTTCTELNTLPFSLSANRFLGGRSKIRIVNDRSVYDTAASISGGCLFVRNVTAGATLYSNLNTTYWMVASGLTPKVYSTEIEFVIPDVTTTSTFEVSTLGPLGLTRTPTVSETFQFTVIPGQLPSINSFTAFRSTSGGSPQNNGSYITITANTTVNSMDSNNTANVSVRRRQAPSGGWTTTQLSTSLNYSTGGYVLSGTFAAASSFDVELMVTDRFGTTSATRQVGTSGALLHMNSQGNGLAIGKYAENQNEFDVQLLSRFRNTVYLQGTTQASGGFYINGPGYFGSMTNKPTARGDLGFGGLSAHILNLVTIANTECFVPIVLTSTGTDPTFYDSSVVVPQLWQNRTFNYIFQIQQTGYYMMSMDYTCQTAGSDTATNAPSVGYISLHSSTSGIPTGSSTTYIDGMSGYPITTGSPGYVPYREISQYAYPGSTSYTCGSIGGVLYCPSGYYVTFRLRVNTIRKQLTAGNIGIALLK